ncbi:ParA family protein [Carnobacteriaceae bacterium zg-ZUI252]|nr:ParA family protein [Carnobacteriaceae bacterium zg-ZUI252]MBS4769686.1 ParA family protein [Carnobacteriaceae bacterium zg-ZUI240]QTU83099.1 ParA family protein [Carnobacteriaceae bacterium zg-C25]
MGKVIAISNQKGGVGKTTTAVNLGAALAYSGRRVLLIDSDSQGNATSGLGVNRGDVEGRDIYSVLIEGVSIRDAIVPSSRENLWIVPATMNLAGAEMEMYTIEHRETLLKRALQDVVHDYDFILIDCPPALGALTLNAFTASDSVLIPVQCEYYALEGLSQLWNTIRLVHQHFNKDLRIEGVLLTMLDTRTNLGAEVVEEVRTYFKEKVYETVIVRNVRLSEAPSYGQSIIDYDLKSRGAQLYLELASEVLAQND